MTALGPKDEKGGDAVRHVEGHGSVEGRLAEAAGVGGHYKDKHARCESEE